MKLFFIKILSSIFKNSNKAYWFSEFKSYRHKYDIDPSFRFNGEGILLYGDGDIRCGKNSYIGWYSTLGAIKGNSIIIGDNCRISHNVRIYTSTNLVDQDFNIMSEKVRKKKGDVTIGNGVWIGVNVIINPGIKIGDNAIIAANTVITKDVFENVLVGSSPQKIIRIKDY